MRIASLSPAATEIVRILDPPDAEIIPIPASTDHQQPLNADTLARLQTDVILSDDPAHADIQIQDCEILIFNPTTPEDLLDGILRIGRILHSQPAAEILMLRQRERIWRAHEYVNPYLDGPAIVVLENLHPLTVAGDPAAHLIERAGGRHLLHPSIAPSALGTASGMQAGQRRAGEPRPIERDMFARARADIVVLALPGRTIEEMRSLWSSSDLPSLADGARIVLVEGDGALHRPGLRMIDAFEFFIGLVQDRPAMMGSRLRWEALT